MSLSIFGVRHHGPGSARSLRQALEILRPDCLLVEGPPDAADALPLLRHSQMKPPVALLIYPPDQPQRAVFYPFAVFSPEWQALDYGLSREIAVRFMDLPQSHRLAAADDAESQISDRKSQIHDDPIASAGGNTWSSIVVTAPIFSPRSWKRWRRCANRPCLMIIPPTPDRKLNEKHG
jgi:hypothetical protein